MPRQILSRRTITSDSTCVCERKTPAAHDGTGDTSVAILFLAVFVGIPAWIVVPPVFESLSDCIKNYESRSDLKKQIAAYRAKEQEGSDGRGSPSYERNRKLY